MLLLILIKLHLVVRLNFSLLRQHKSKFIWQKDVHLICIVSHFQKQMGSAFIK